MEQAGSTATEAGAVMTRIDGRLPRRGDVVRLWLDGVDADGVATGRLEGVLDRGKTAVSALVAARGGLPGDEVEVEVTARGGGVVSGRVLRVLTPSPDRVTPACPHAADGATGSACGGCTLQGLAYPAQLAVKRGRITTLLAEAGLDVAVAEPLGAEVRLRHRHKMEFSFGRSGGRGDADAELVLGLHPRGHRWEVLPLATCLMLSDGAFAIAEAVREAARALGLRARDDRDQTGWLETLSIRESRRAGATDATDEDDATGLAQAPWRLVELTTADVPEVATQDGPQPPEAVARALAAVAAALPQVVGVLWTRRRAARGSPTTRATMCLEGQAFLPEALARPNGAPLSLHVSPQAFFQPHPRQAERLIARIGLRLAAEAARLGRGLNLADLYCGTGTLGLALAGVVARLVGVELVPEAVADAQANAARNGIDNATFLAGDVGAVLADASLARHFRDIDAVIVDPPRAGLMPQASQHLAALGARLLVYVSCNPASLARDLPVLAGLGYALEGALEPVDLFPQTHHIETLACFVREAGPGGLTEAP
jgi:23S rRNA (uracil1939-C5)-methyltransferase